MTTLGDLKLGIYEKAIPLQLSWIEKMNTAKAAGFDFIELSVDGLEPRIHRLDWDDAQINEIRRASEITGVPLLTMALTANRYFPLGDPARREQGIEIVRKGIRLAMRLGIRIIQLAPYDVNPALDGREGNEGTLGLFKDSLRRLVTYAADCGVMLSLEVVDDVRFCRSVQSVRQLIEEIDSPFLQIYTDTGNVAALDADPVPDIPNGGSHLIASHLKDAVLGCCRKVEYGKGIVDFEACLRAFKEMDFHGFFVCEMWSDEEESFIPYLKVANDFLRAKIRAVDQACEPKIQKENQPA